MTQLDLIEPTAREAVALVTAHLEHARKAQRLAAAFEARSMHQLAAWELSRAAQSCQQADDLAAYFDLCLYAGVLDD